VSDVRAPTLGFSYEGAVAETVEWYTPPSVFAALGLTFDLDPCSPMDGPVPWVPASRHWTATDDGLTQPWEGRVWLNPPYGPGIGAWLDRLAEHGDGVALVPARLDTAWGQAAVRSADVVCFPAGRIRFVRRDGTRGDSPGFGSMILGHGTCADAVRGCGLGVVAVFT